MAQLAQGLAFDLANAFAGHGEALTHFDCNQLRIMCCRVKSLRNLLCHLRLFCDF